MTFVFADGSRHTLPSAKYFANLLEQYARLRLHSQQRFAQIDAEFQSLRRRTGKGGRYSPEALAQVQRLDEERRGAEQAIADADLGRTQLVAQLQLVFDLAYRERKTKKAAGHVGELQGNQTRLDFACALDAAAATGKHLTGESVLEHWPNASPPSLRRVQQLLQECRQRDDG